MQRLDKLLAQAKIGSRTDCEKLIRKGLVCVNSQVIKKSETKVELTDTITVEGEPVEMPRKVVCIMNKPAGFVCSTEDPRDKTVMEILPPSLLRQDIVPAGRLDKDTEGLLVFSNDGELIHKLISPKSNIKKVYYVEYEGQMPEDAEKKAKEGLILKDHSVCKSAVIENLEEGKATITITEGMYHQVKRMFASLGMHITYLKRISIGNIELGTLEAGFTKELSKEETSELFR